MLSIRLLGPPDVRCDGQPLTVRRRLVRALLYYLAAQRVPVPRDRLAFLLAPDRSQREAARHLSHLLSWLRAELGPCGACCLWADTTHVALNEHTWVDLATFERGTAPLLSGSSPSDRATLEGAERALALYRGEFLSGVTLPHHAEYEGWVLLERERLARRFVDALARLAEGWAQQGAFDRAILHAQRALEVNPLREDLHRLLMQLYAATGRRTDALLQYERCVVALEKELGVDPLPETQAVYQAIVQQQPAVVHAPPSHFPTPPWHEPPGLEETLAAAHASAAGFAYHHVLTLTEQALRLLDTTPPGKQRDRRHLEVLLLRGAAHRALRACGEARAELHEALRLAEELEDQHAQVEVLCHLAPVLLDQADYKRAKQVAEHGVAVARALGAPDLLGRALSVYLLVAAAAGERVPQALLEEAARLLGAAQDHVGLAELWNAVGIGAMQHGHYAEALEAFDKARQEARRVGHHFLVHRAEANRGHVLYDMGRFPAAWQAFKRAEHFLDDVALTRPDELWNIGYAYTALHLGHTQEAEQTLLRTLNLLERVQASRSLVWVHLAALRLLQGRLDEARKLIRRARQEEVEGRFGPILWIRELEGRLLRQAGNARAARAVHEWAAVRARMWGNERRLASLWCELGWDLLAQQRRNEARRSFTVARDLASRRGEMGTVAAAQTGLAACLPGCQHTADQAVEAARATGSLLLLAEAACVAARTYRCLGDQQGAERLLAEVLPRVQCAGWTMLISRLQRLRRVTNCDALGKCVAP